jgi:chromosome partitioning protein
VLNPKGGCGKTTIATNLASVFAAHGEHTVLLDYDRQGSSTHWLAGRPASHRPIHGISACRQPPGVTRSYHLRLPQPTTRVVVDTPAGVSRSEFQDLVARTDGILVPVLPSPSDLSALGEFLVELGELARVRSGQVRVGVVANRVRGDIDSMQLIDALLARLPFRLVTRLRETPNYLRAFGLGLGIHDLPLAQSRRDREQWAPLLSWLAHSDEVPSAVPGVQVR